MTCPSCGAELAGETVLEDLHVPETVLLGTRATKPAEREDTRRDVAAFQSEPPPPPPPPPLAPSAGEGQPFAERADESQVTAEVLRDPRHAEPAPASAFSSSEPPTRFLRGTDDHIELPAGSVVDDFEVEAKIGEGAMGVVYAARHVRLGRRVAIKVIAPGLGADPQALARFEREARTLATMRHPNVVDVLAFGALPDGRSYFVMEHLDGESLDERIDRGRVPLDEALDVLDQVARALEAAHAQGVVHRDLKPSNMFLVRIAREDRAVAKLLDFGLARSAAADGVEKTASGTVFGTSMYMSPEQCRGPDVDGRADVYALGCIGYELLLYRHPFPDVRTPLAAIAAHLTQAPPQPRAIWPGIPAALDLLLHAMLAKDPRYRPSLAQVRHVVVSVRSTTTARAATATARRDLRARLWLVALVTFALIVGILIGASVGGGRARSVPPASVSPRPTVVPIRGPSVTPIDQERR